jgi:hypothetical protein
MTAAPVKVDAITWHPKITVAKYSDKTIAGLRDALGYEPIGKELLSYDPDSRIEDEGNQLVTVGLSRIGNLIIGSGAAAFNSTQAVCGVGSSSTAFSVSQTALSGDGSTTTAYYQVVDSAPSNVNGAISANATFTTGNANFAWNEWCWGIATSTITAGGTFASIGTSPVMLNRKVVSLGTKSSGSWVLQATVTLS